MTRFCKCPDKYAHSLCATRAVLPRVFGGERPRCDVCKAACTLRLYSVPARNSVYARTYDKPFRVRAAICVLTAVSMDSQTRRACPFPPELVKRAQSLVRPYELASSS